MIEDEFERAVVDIAHLFGWRAVGHRPMRTKHHGWRTGWKYDGTGWPDLTLVHHDGYIIAAELKVESRLSPEQVAWGDLLTAVQEHIAPRFVYALWRPADLPAIKSILSFGRAS